MVSEDIIEKVECEKRQSKWGRKLCKHQWEKHYKQREMVYKDIEAGAC